MRLGRHSIRCLARSSTRDIATRAAPTIPASLARRAFTNRLPPGSTIVARGRKRFDRSCEYSIVIIPDAASQHDELGHERVQQRPDGSCQHPCDRVTIANAADSPRNAAANTCRLS